MSKELNFKIRASAASQIMTQPKTKKDKEAGLLGGTAKTYCETWLKEQLYERKKEFSNKYTQKGIIVEDNSIDYYAEFKGYPMLLKNETFFSDDFMQGTPDVVLPDLVIDIKSSWDAFSFPLFEDTPPAAYVWQAQVYMHLTGRVKYDLAYVLIDTPAHLIEKEAYYYCNANGYDFDEGILKEFTDKMTYSKVPYNLRLKTYSIYYDPNMVDALIEQVHKCRKYINELKLKIK